MSVDVQAHAPSLEEAESFLSKVIVKSYMIKHNRAANTHELNKNVRGLLPRALPHTGR